MTPFFPNYAPLALFAAGYLAAAIGIVIGAIITHLGGKNA